MTRSTRSHVLAVVAMALAAAFLASCGSDDDGPEMPNPASAFCEEQGGRVEIESDAAGNQTGFCVLPSGERVDEWEYYRENNAEGS